MRAKVSRTKHRSMTDLYHNRQALAEALYPSLCGSADAEYQTRIEAQRVTLQFSQPITAPANALDYNDLPLFGGNKQEELF